MPSKDTFLLKPLEYEIDNIALCTTGTNAIYSSLSLLSQKAKNFLLISPTYFLYKDLLVNMGCNISFFQYNESLYEPFNFEKFIDLLNIKNINAIIIIDPIFAIGKAVSLNLINFIANECIKRNIWLIVDNMYGCSEWSKEETENTYFNINKLQIIMKTERYIFIDSISKRVGINGNKIAIVISSKEFIEDLNNFALYCIGSLCATQIEMANELYAIENKQYIKKCLTDNINNAQSVYKLLSSILLQSKLHLSDTDSGLFTSIHIPKNLLPNYDDIKIADFLFRELNLLTLPLSLFDFKKEEYYSFRINLMLDKSNLLRYINNLQIFFDR